MRWNKSVNAERQALVAAAMGYPGEDPGEVLNSFIAGRGMPRCLSAVRVGPESFARLAERAMDTLGAAQPAADRRPRPGSRDPRTGRLNGTHSQDPAENFQWTGRRFLAARWLMLSADRGQTEVDADQGLV